MSSYQEKLGRIGSSDTESLYLRIATDGKLGTLAINSSTIAYGTSTHGFKSTFDETTIDFARLLVEMPDTPILKKTMNLEDKIDKEVDASDSFRRLIQKTPEPLKSHFIKFGRGSATWYGFLLDNQDPGKILEKGRIIVDTEPSSLKRRIRARAFEALERQYYGAEKENSKIIPASAGSAILVMIGATVAYHYVSHKKPTLDN